MKIKLAATCLFGLEKLLGEELLIPESALRHGEEVFLCGMSVPILSAALGVKVTPVSDGCDLFIKLLGQE